MPEAHTGTGEDVSPALAWSGAPEATASFAVICHDPDAPLVTSEGRYGFAHWILYNIPPPKQWKSTERNNDDVGVGHILAIAPSATVRRLTNPLQSD